MRRQTPTSGINSAGSSRALRLDPLSLPLSFHAQDARADGGMRQVELHREHVVLRRAVLGMRMAVNVRVSDFLGVALRGIDDAQMLVLVHRDPALSIPLGTSSDAEEISSAWQMWSDIFHLPQLTEPAPRQPAPRRRRRNAIRARRPKFLVRRRTGVSLNGTSVHRDEREIIARD
ncbi:MULTISPECIES: DUF6101 family protein [unclassified Bradyrhizobium]|uniref:DUF6101 family protein n=1 Tax=unclassified Bradyrhizobium TaxID=2631580 RepID=UPI001BAD8347|nr:MULTISPECIES: DUF6101 family protein [unclassified Bradyrhizobium]MBR1203182.1 hypothetical protein [Bradyrhizobium sp. AUGA SZCCT0124]MBR1312845.1 hypothetical protein [Bradyrhizobium sp. AUGA SZCCT0051]MBR1341203.1 hypothetical protein [Bradyrhizobium sp. AUGA SZCCT0105]MBR1356859.1 hypothetical protein [Bradyrhizobium sp. AUGA SZCCT0045]